MSNISLSESQDSFKETRKMAGTNEADGVKTAQHDRQSELREFDETKAGVKGLIDAGITKIPSFFIDENDKPGFNPSNDNPKFVFPIIDIKGIDDAAKRAEIVGQVKEACEQWGFFQIVNHEIPASTMDEIIEAVRKFNEQDAEVKKEYYTRDPGRRFQFKSNYNLYTEPAAWRDSVTCVMFPNPPDPQEFPNVLRGIMFEYSKHVKEVAHTIYELLSEALGLNPSHLKDIGCAETLFLAGHYHPPCPEPELTFGNRTHIDMGLLTILLQDQTGGFQVLHQDQWVDVPPVVGGLVINVGEFMQLLTNDKFKGVKHRALVKKESTRISVAAFAKPRTNSDNRRVCGPIKELINEEEPPIYRETTYEDFEKFYMSKTDGKAKLPYFKLFNI